MRRLRRFDLKRPILNYLVILEEKSDHRRTPVFLIKEAATWVLVRGGLRLKADLVFWL